MTKARAAGRLPRGPRVVLVEREGQGRELEAHFLREVGLDVEVASDGPTAWETIQKELPDLVVSEVLLPRMDGLSLCRQIKGSPATRHIAVVLVSMLAAGARAREAGASAFLLKPLSQHRLLDEIPRLLPTAPEPLQEGA
jgi:CheY-like chemotaxis protein